MKKLHFLLFCFYAVHANAQQVVVANQELNIVYCNTYNPLSVIATGYACQAIVITTNNGKITKSGCGMFMHYPIKPGPFTFIIWVKHGKKLRKIGKIAYRAKPSPPPVAMVGSYKGGKIPARVFRAMGGVRAWINCSDAPLQVASFTITLIRDKKPVFWLDNIGSRFSDEVTDSLQNLVADDIIFITAIEVKMPNGETEEVSFLKFIVSD